MEKLKVESLVSAELRVSNADMDSRQYDINAVVRVDNGSVNSITQGAVTQKDSADGMDRQLATFDSWGSESLNIQFQAKDERDSILASVEAFIGKCRTDKELTATSVNA